MTGRLAAPTLLAAVLLLGACADRTPWTHPSVPRDQWSSDLASCQARAQRLMRRDVHRDDPFGDRDNTSLDRRMTAFEMRKREKSLIERCMRDKGYRPVQPVDGQKGEEA